MERTGVRGAALRCTLTVLTVLTVLTACGDGTGTCEGEYAAGKYVCKDGWDREECADWDAQEVNGSAWSFHEGQTCSERGFATRCSDGSFVRDRCP